MGDFEAKNLDDLFGRMQGEELGRTEDGRRLIQRCKEDPMIHTSMSVGDVAVDAGGQRWLCAAFGWKPFGEATADHVPAEETA